MPDEELLPKLMAFARGVDRDDDFHLPKTLDFHWTETCWFSLVIPDRKITVQLYPFFQPNLGVCSAAAYIWDDSGDQWWNCRYYKNFWHLPFPKQPLHDLELPNGIRYRCLDSHRRYAIGFDCPDGQDVHLDVTWEAVIPVNRAPTGTHLDQPGRITGTLVLDGEAIEIDGVGFRDRTWSPRSQFGQGIGPFESMGYTWGTSLHSDDGFFLLSGNLDDGYLRYGLLDGLLYRDGEVAKLTEARRTLAARDPETGCPSGAAIELVDEQGRRAQITGTNVNRFAANLYPNLLVWECQTQWSMDGIDLVGEDEDNWGVHPFRTWLRSW
jgi:hypothetical protein